MDSPGIVTRVAARAQGAGFDLVHAFAVGWYNEAVEEALRLPNFGRPQSLAILIGNTAALWPRFKAQLAAEPGLAAESDPLDRYTEASLRAAAADLPMATELRFAHDPPPRRVAMQRLADLSGLAPLAPSYLNVHPTYGPWFALRAVLVVDAPGPETPPPRPPACAACAERCLPAFERAVAAGIPTGEAELREHWRLWLAVRDACPTGRQHRYGEEQLRYHYTKRW